MLVCISHRQNDLGLHPGSRSRVEITVRGGLDLFRLRREIDPWRFPHAYPSAWDATFRHVLNREEWIVAPLVGGGGQRDQPMTSCLDS